MYKFKMTEATFNMLDQNYSGVCLHCHEIQDGGCEPDAEYYHCDECNHDSVFGIQQALVYGRIEIVESEANENVAA